MIDSDFMFAVAEVGATYAGFSTLVAVVAYKGETGAIPARIYFMLLLTLIVVACSILPVLLANYGLAEDVALRLASAVYAVAWGVYWVNAVFFGLKRFGNIRKLSLLNHFHTWILHPASVLVLAAGAFGLWGAQIGAVYITALFVMLYMSAFLFFQVVLGILKR